MPETLPIWLNPNGSWCKKHKGHVYYFGRNKDEALRRYVVEWPDILKGRPRPEQSASPASTEAVTVGYLCNAYLARKRERVRSGEMSEAGWSHVRHMTVRVIDVLGRHRHVAELGPPDYARLRDAAATAFNSPRTLKLFVGYARGLFRFGAELVDRVPKYGGAFDPPPARVMRLHRQEQGERLLPADDLRKVLDAAEPTMRAAVLLGVNCAFGATDLSELRQSHVEKRPGWIALTRHKTGIARRCPLWPETAVAIEEAWRVRPRPFDQADADRLFLTATGLPVVRWVQGPGKKVGGTKNAVGQDFAALCKRLGVALPRQTGFSVLRKCFRTAADELRDVPAIDLVMGHTRKEMADAYVERMTDERLQAVVDHVRAWLFGRRPAKGRKAKRGA